MLCTNCGTLLPDDAQFCSRCGKALGEVTLLDQTSPPGPSPPIKEPGKFKRFCEALVPLGDTVGGFIVSPIVFFLVLAGIVEATGSPPGGILRGSLGAVISFGLHALWGTLAAVFGVIGWLGAFLLIFGFLGAVRRRCSWYVGPLGVLVMIAASTLDSARNALADWLGSASSSDAAPLWGALAGTYISMGCRVPLWLREIWQWSNTKYEHVKRLSYFRRVMMLHELMTGSDDTEGMGKNIIYTVDAALLFALCLVGWQLNGWLGLIIALVISGTLWNFGRAVLWLFGGTFVSLCVMLPFSAVLAIWEPFMEGEILDRELADAMTYIRFRSRSSPRDGPDTSPEEINDIIRAYGAAMEAFSSYVWGVSERFLPFPREQIKQALLRALLQSAGGEDIRVLERGFLDLARFLPEPDGTTAMDVHLAIVGGTTEESAARMLDPANWETAKEGPRLLGLVNERRDQLVVEFQNIRKLREVLAQHGS